MKKNKIIIILTIILLILISIIVLLTININKNNTFIKPEFEKNISTDIPDNLEYESSVIEIMEGYNIYIDANPKINNNNQLTINFISLKENNIWIKIRILNENKKILGESGIIKPGEYLEVIELDKKLNNNDSITYEIIGYEKDTYLSAGTIKLNTRVGA